MRRIALIVGLTLVVSVVAASTGNLTIAVGQVGSILPATLTPTGTTQTVDWNDSNVQKIDLESATGDVTLTLSNPISGFSYALEIQQDGAGGARNIIWPAAVTWQGGVAPVITTANDAIDVVSCMYVGTSYRCDRGAAYAVP